MDGITKTCTKCGEIYPATEEYFNKQKRGKFGLRANCKNCQRAWRNNNQEHINKYQNNWRKNNKEKLKSYEVDRSQRDRKYREKHKKRRYEVNEVWRKNNHDKLKMYTQKRRSLKSKLPASFTKTQWNECKKYFDYQCAYCGNSDKKLHQDHFIPLVKGGEYTKQNIIPSCASCNSSKRDKDFKEWYRDREYYDEARERKILNYLGYKNKQQQLALI